MDIFRIGRLIPLRYSVLLALTLTSGVGVAALFTSVDQAAPTDFRGIVVESQAEQFSRGGFLHYRYRVTIENEAGKAVTRVSDYPTSCYLGDKGLYTAAGNLLCAEGEN